MGTQSGFLEVNPYQGFDGSDSNQRWQYVPIGGGRLVAIHTVSGAQLRDLTGPIEVFEVYSKAPSNASFDVKGWSAAVSMAQSQSTQLRGARFFAIKGKSIGVGRFRVGAFWLNVDVGNSAMLVPVHLHLVTDVDRDFKSHRTEQEVRDMVKCANKVLEPQTGFRFELQGVSSFTCGKKVGGASKSFGAEILHDRHPTTDQPNKPNDETQWIVDRGVHEAVNFFFVWNFRSTQAEPKVPAPKAVAILDRSVLMTNFYQRADVAGPVMVHEFIHNCGHRAHDDLHENSIMNAKVSKANIRHSHLVKMREWNAKPW